MGIDYKGSGGGVSDHGALSGLADDDHSQYHNDARANTWLGTKDTDDLVEGTSNLYDSAAEKDTHDHGRLARNSATQIQIEALSDTHNFVYVNGESVSLSSAIVCDSTDNLIASDGTDSGGSVSASTKYYAYLSNSLASFAPSDLRLSSTAPTDGYLAATGNGANWRYVGIVYTNSSSQFDAIGAVRDVETVPIFPSKVTCWHDESVVVAGNSISPAVDTAQVYNIFSLQSTAADADEFYQEIFLGKGTYSFSVLGRTNADFGKVDWYLDNTIIASGQDWYSAALVVNVTKTIAGITVSRPGKYRIRGRINGKNASSTGYKLPLTKFWFTKTA